MQPFPPCLNVNCCGDVTDPVFQWLSGSSFCTLRVRSNPHMMVMTAKESCVCVCVCFPYTHFLLFSCFRAYFLRNDWNTYVF